jgi:hypothetical protein
MVIGTICAANHLPKAACLASSLKATQPKHEFALCLVERDRSALCSIEGAFPEIILASEIGIPNFSSFVFRHERYEACCAVKAQFMLWAMERFPDEQDFLYLDPDVMAYSSFEELEAVLPSSQIVVTPHQLHDENSEIGIRENTFRTLIAGTFNLGFLALRRSQAAADFLCWWNSKLQALCYMEWRTRGLFVDQKWALLGLSFFDMSILREPGYNVANWNVSQRHVTSDPSNHYFVNGKPLRFFHFSNIDSDRDLYFFKRFLDCSSPVFSLREEYLQALDSLGAREFYKTPWSYGQFLSGDPINLETRLVYRSNPKSLDRLPEPFAESNSRFYAVMAESPRTPSRAGRKTGHLLSMNR